MVRIRLTRLGAKGHPSYRIVVADQRASRDGRAIDQIGVYDPVPEPPHIRIDQDKALAWLRNGAQPSDSVRDLFRRTGILEKLKEAPAGG